MNEPLSNPTLRPVAAVPYPPAVNGPEAEPPSFIDLLLTLLRHKRIVILGTLIGAAGGVLLAVVLPRSYTVTTIIQLGTFQQDATTAIEPPEAVLAKITNAYQPVVERAHALETAQPAFTLGLDVRNPRGTTLVLLTSKTTTERETEHLALHRQVAERVLDDHRREFQFVRTNLGLELDQARRSAAAIKDQAVTFALRKTLLHEKRTLVERRMAELDSELARIASNRDAAGKNVTGQDQVLTLMMLDQQVARERDKRDELVRQQAIGLAEEADRLARDEADLQRAQQAQEGAIAAIQARIANVAETKLIGEPQRSLKPTGMGRSVIAALGLILGLTGGVTLVFMREGVREHQQRLGASQSQS